jgi:hypothetical protein
MPSLEPTEMDAAIQQLIADALAAYPPGSGTLDHAWSEEARMWFTKVTPHDPAAASVSVAFDEPDLLSINVGHTWFEIFPVTAPDQLDYLRDIIDAVLAGRVEEAGLPGKEYARIDTKSGPVGVGAAHPPWPWKGRMTHRYKPYGSSA